MIWNSITLMTLIDIVHVIGVVFLVFLFRQQREAARQLGALPALHFILAGLLVVAVFYLFDLVSMHLVPLLTSHEVGMALMTELHLNWSWLATLLSVGLMAVGLFFLMKRLIPQASANMQALERVVEERSTELRKANLKLEQEHRKVLESEERLDLASKATDDGIWEIAEFDCDGSCEGWWSQRYRELLDVAPGTDSVDDVYWRTRIHPRDEKRVLEAFQAHIEKRVRFDVECRLSCGAHGFRWFRLSGQAIWDDGGKPNRMAGSIRDITDKKHAEQRMEELDLAIENSMTGVSRLDTAGLFTEVRDNYAAMLGYEDSTELIGQSWENTVAPEDHESARQACAVMLRDGRAETQIRALRRDGSEFIKKLLLVRIDDELGEHDGHYCFMRDVTIEHALNEKLSHQASHDTLTGLLNRAELENRLDQAISSADMQQRTHALLYMDLDQFKVINDSCGHLAGDELLRQLARLLETRIRLNDTLARLGGDEFGALLEDCTLEQAMRVAENLRSAVEDFVFSFADNSYSLGVSIGLVSIDAASGTKSEILKDADAACYAAKDGGRNRLHVYRPDDVRLAMRKGEMQWVSRINSALAEDRLELYRQPIVSTRDALDSGARFELLVRLRDENGELVPPGAFLPAANRYDLLPRVDRWVIAHALQWLAKHEHTEGVTLCHINISGPSLAAQEFLDFVLQSFDETAVDPGRVCFEITENAAISNLANARRFIDACRARGCKFALDDFGNGLSSFGYLKTLAVDFVKIDGTFVRDMLVDPVDLAMVKAIDNVAKVMGISSIAEYVESDEILEALRDLGIDDAQGYWVGRPVPLVATISDGPKAAVR